MFLKLITKKKIQQKRTIICQKFFFKKSNVSVCVCFFSFSVYLVSWIWIISQSFLVNDVTNNTECIKFRLEFVYAFIFQLYLSVLYKAGIYIFLYILYIGIYMCMPFFFWI